MQAHFLSIQNQIAFKELAEKSQIIPKSHGT